MKHFHIIVNGYRKHNIAFAGASKEQLCYAVMVHLNALPKIKREICF